MRRSAKSTGRLIQQAMLALACLIAPAAATGQCVGDCDASGSITVDEVLTGVSIALGARQLDECPAFDVDSSQSVTVDELIQSLNAALTGCELPPTPMPTETATALPPPTPTATIAGPIITYFGLAGASAQELQPTTFDGDIPVFERAAGAGFIIVVEAKLGDGTLLGNASMRSDPFNPRVRPDLQIQANRDLGNGSVAICDKRSPPPGTDPGGGVPGINPPSYSPDSQLIADALNDFGCRFSFHLSNEPCTYSSLGNPRFLRNDTQAQFCTDDVVATYWRFPPGDTLVTVRWADQRGNLGAPRQLIVRVRTP